MTQVPVWRVLGQSVRGASHVRASLPNQDALLWWSPASQGPPIVLVVSDGHGSDKSFRSEIGSRFAVEQTVALLRQLVEAIPTPPNLSAVKRTAEERLPQELVRGWQMAVDAHLAEHPFEEGELARLDAKRGPKGRQEVLANPRLAYGATLLATLIANDFLLFLQLGDGDILTVQDGGEVVRPLPRDARLIANETTSLCMARAWREIRLRFQASYGGVPALVLLSTDGYANSFVNEAAFLKVGSDLLGILNDEGAGAVERNLVTWLQEASESGSGDDITLGILYRADVATERPAEPVRAIEAPVAATPTPEPVEKHRPPPPVADDTAHVHGRSGQQLTPAERSAIMATIKQKGPTEPSKHGRVADMVEERPGGVAGDEVRDETDADAPA